MECASSECRLTRKRKSISFCSPKDQNMSRSFPPFVSISCVLFFVFFFFFFIFALVFMSFFYRFSFFARLKDVVSMIVLWSLGSFVSHPHLSVEWKEET